MNCALVFDPEGFESADADLLISLSPEASFSFERRGIGYRLMTDFYRESDLFGSDFRKAYFESQMEFMTEMDAYFQRYSSLCRTFGIPLCSINFLMIKYAMDTVNVDGWILEQFFEANPGIRSVTLGLGKGPNGEHPPSFFFFRASQNAVYAKVLQSLCERRGISFTAVQTAPNAQKVPAAASSPLRRIREVAKNWCKIPYRYLSYRKFSRSLAASPESLLFLHHGAYEIDHFIRQAVSGGMRAFVREGRRLILENTTLRTAVTANPGKASVELRNDLHRCAEDILKNDAGWTSRLEAASLWRGAAEILRPFFARYAENEACRLLSEAEAWKRRLEENRIDVVLARGNTDLDSLAVLIAAKYLASKKAVCVQHAPSALGGEAMGVYDSAGFDYLLARDRVTYGYFKSLGFEESRLGWSTHYLNHLKKASWKNRRRPRAAKIAYIPKKFYEDIRNINEFSYPYVWYYEWQKKIMDLFAKLGPRRFVYKNVPQHGWAYRSILPYIRGLGADNIEVMEAPFSKIIDRFDRVITDFPSGAFFESLAAGQSVLCVQPGFFEINPEAKRLFGRCFASFETIGESLAAIEKFVRSDADAYRAELPAEEMDLSRLVSNAFAAPAARVAAEVKG